MSRNGGFTLMELVMVMSIIGILSVLAVPSLSGFAQGRTDVAALRLAADLRHARSLAMGTHTATSVSFNVATGTCTVYEDDATADIAKDPVTQTEDGFVVVFGSVETMGVSLGTADFGGVPKVVFNADGFPVSAGSVTVTGNGITHTVAVTAAGRVTVQ